MYYYYHQYLQGVLAAEQWVTADDLRRQPYSLLSLPSHKEANELFTRVKKTLGKEVGRHVTIMKESTVQKPDAWPIRTQGSPNVPVDAQGQHPKLISYLLSCEAGNYQLKDSSHLVAHWDYFVSLPLEQTTESSEFEYPSISESYQFSQDTESETSETVNSAEQEKIQETILEPIPIAAYNYDDIYDSEFSPQPTTGFSPGELSPELIDPDTPRYTQEEVQFITKETLENLRPMLNFAQLHQNFNSKKQYTAVKEDGKIILENATLTFDGYQLAQDIDQAAELLNKIFGHIEDISLNYGDALQDIEAQINDELHFIEFADVDTNRCVKSYKHLQDLRVKRRCLKDSMQMANLLVRTMGKELPKKLSIVSEKINQLDQRTYEVRVPEKFQH